MDFFGIGPLELVLILVVALLVVGPQRIPEIARTVGRTVRAIKKVTMDISQQVNKELQTEQMPPLQKDKVSPENK